MKMDYLKFLVAVAVAALFSASLCDGAAPFENQSGVELRSTNDATKIKRSITSQERVNSNNGNSPITDTRTNDINEPQSQPTDIDANQDTLSQPAETKPGETLAAETQPPVTQPPVTKPPVTPADQPEPDPKCPVQVDCTTVTGNIPIENLGQCNDGYYCVCDSSLGYAVQQQCPYNNLLSKKRQKLDAVTKECVNSDEFNCWNWLGLDPDPSQLCPITVNCTQVEKDKKIPIPIADECDAGYYCTCDNSGMALKEKCPYNGLFSLTSKKLDAYSLKCVKSNEFDCGNWINTPTTVLPPITPLSKDCPIAVDCSAVAAGQKIPIAVESECESGHYCECVAGVAIKQTCPFNGIFSFKARKLNGYTLECVKRNRFDCREWIRDLLSPTSPAQTTPRVTITNTPQSSGDGPGPITANPYQQHTTLTPDPDPTTEAPSPSSASQLTSTLLLLILGSVPLLS